MKQKKIVLIIIVFFFCPINVFSYSSQIIPGGENIGIKISNEGIMIVGFYKVNGKYNRHDLKVGDTIIAVNDEKVKTIDELIASIEKNIVNNEVILTYLRNNKARNSILQLSKIDGTYKTGLYVKDSMTGIGTLTYIDPNTKIYGALGHEIVENSTKQLIEVKEGNIFRSSVTSITKSSDGNPGSKNAKFYYPTEYGIIVKNTRYGIYGIYQDSLPNKDLLTVASSEEVKLGDATINTVLEQEDINSFDINITAIDEKNDTKNIYFDITDEELLEKTGGVVQGMSGSPIMQNNKIVGCVTHVVIDNVKSGYGIFISTMLIEGEKQ